MIFKTIFLLQYFIMAFTVKMNLLFKKPKIKFRIYIY